MKNTLYDRLEYDAIKTEWHTWMSETAQALRHTDICRFGTWRELERLSKNIPAMRWLVCKLDGYNINPSPDVPALAAIFILACYCPDNRVLGYVVDTLMLCYRTSDRKGLLMCARIHSVVNRNEEYSHLNGLYNIMMGFFLKEFARFLGPEWKGGSFLTENDFREAERYLPDFKASGFKEMVLARVTSQMTGEELARRCNMSNTAFRERFKETFGTTVSHWLRERKKDRILNSLLHTDLPISKISDHNGFRNDSTFSEYCRRNFGSAPSEIRKNKTLTKT
ncbi:helix-turn-helix transcriptional regulator [Phocaeicola sartorii]|uniref:helix-turn-helix transcriptional regulator n=1 Tax=Phocaeicola sartorii TaxID=671267 RepID=UPI002558386F|nr:helix-turn-helix transcriptional regulator [Phocaeicola sartorii]